MVGASPSSSGPFDRAWPLYADTRDRFLALVRSASPAQIDQVVPLTPGWTVAQVLAHVCGLNADVAAGMREGLGADERTARQVSVRAGRSVEAVASEWVGHGPAVEAAMTGDEFFGRRLAADLVVHLHDISHALGCLVDQADAATISAAHTYARRRAELVTVEAGVGLTIDLGGGHRFSPGSEPGADVAPVAVATSPFDFLRSVTGRRSRRQVEALDWTGDPVAVALAIDHLCPYGPLPTADTSL